MKVELKFTDADARTIAYFLRIRYGKRKDCSLETLVMIAIRREVAEQARVESEGAVIDPDDAEWLDTPFRID